MRCPSCSTENRSGARFCGRCGEPLEVQPSAAQSPVPSTCPTCGTPTNPGAKFCPRCGSALAAPAAAAMPPASSAVAPSQAYTPSPSPEPYAPYPEPQVPEVSREPTGVPARKRGPVWPLAVVAALVSGALLLCVVVGLAVAPAFGQSVPPLPEVDPNSPDITILVEEAYISDMVADALPDVIDGDAVLDVQPENLIVVTVDFQLLIVKLQVVVNSRIAVESGEIQVSVESVETGGRDLLDLIGMDQITLGDDITEAIQKGLEDELGEGARLLTITTDEQRVILTARWE